MPRHSDDPVKHVVTFRVNSEEKRALEMLAEQSGRTVSNFMRFKLQLLRDKESLIHLLSSNKNNGFGI